jgi:hypothetical protein
MPLGLGARLPGVSTSLDTNGHSEWPQTPIADAEFLPVA